MDEDEDGEDQEEEEEEESGFVGDRKKEPRAPGQDRSGARLRVTVDEALNSPSSVGV